LTPETGESGNTEEENAPPAMAPEQPVEPAAQSPEMKPQVEGKRTQLKIVRENIQTLSRDVGDFRRVHVLSTKKLEAELAALRRDIAANARAKDLASHVKSHEVSANKLEKQVTNLRNELAALKSSMAKDAARGRAKQEALLNKVLSKVSAKPARPKPAKAKPAPAKTKKK